MKLEDVKACHYSWNNLFGDPRSIFDIEGAPHGMKGRDGLSDRFMLFRSLFEKEARKIAVEMLGSAVEVNHPLYVAVFPDPLWIKGTVFEKARKFEVDPSLLKKCTFFMGDSGLHAPFYCNAHTEEDFLKALDQHLVLYGIDDILEMLDGPPRQIEGHLWSKFRVSGSRLTT